MQSKKSLKSDVAIKCTSLISNVDATGCIFSWCQTSTLSMQDHLFTLKNNFREYGKTASLL